MQFPASLAIFQVFSHHVRLMADILDSRGATFPSLQKLLLDGAGLQALSFQDERPSKEQRSYKKLLSWCP